MATGIWLNSLHDIQMENGRLMMTSDATKVAQDVKTRIMMVQGEETLDNDYGFPYQELLGSQDMERFESELKLMILETEGVQELIEFLLDFNTETRKLQATFAAATIYGEIDQEVSFNGRYG